MMLTVGFLKRWEFVMAGLKDMENKDLAYCTAESFVFLFISRTILE